MTGPESCSCDVAPMVHIHVSTQAELDEGRNIYPHTWFEHDPGCTCSVHEA